MLLFEEMIDKETGEGAGAGNFSNKDELHRSTSGGKDKPVQSTNQENLQLEAYKNSKWGKLVDAFDRIVEYDRVKGVDSSSSRQLKKWLNWMKTEGYLKDDDEIGDAIVNQFWDEEYRSSK